MRSLAALAAVAALLSACGPSAPTAAPEPAHAPSAPAAAPAQEPAANPAPNPAPAAGVPAGATPADPAAAAAALAARFLTPSTPHAVTYAITEAGEPPRTVTMRRETARQRYESPESGNLGVVVIDFAAERVLAFQVGETVPADERVATVIPYGQFGGMADFGLDEVVNADARATVTGEDSVIGERCTVWRIEDVADGEINEVCVTGDDIVLRSAKPGAAPDLIATELVRGPQAEALFAAPEGYRIMDMGAMIGALGAAAGGAQFDEESLRALLNRPQN